MKKLLIVALLISVPKICSADYELRLHDGVTLNWREYSVEGEQYCTRKEFGRFCIQKSDVASLKKVGGRAGDTGRASKERITVNAPETNVGTRYQAGNEVLFEFYSSHETDVRLAYIDKLGDEWRFKNMTRDGSRFYVYHPVGREIWYEFVVPTNTWYRRDPLNRYIDNNHPYLNRGGQPLTSNRNLNVTYVAGKHVDYFTTGDGSNIKRLEMLYRELTNDKLALFGERIEPIHGKKIRYYGGIFPGTYAEAGSATVVDHGDHGSSHEMIHVLLYKYPHFGPFAEGIAQCFQEEGNRLPLTEQNCSLASRKEVKEQGTKLWDVLSDFSAHQDYHMAGSFVYFHLFVEKDTTGSFINFLKELKPDLDFTTVRKLYKRHLGKDMQYYAAKWEQWVDGINDTSDVFVPWGDRVAERADTAAGVLSTQGSVRGNTGLDLPSMDFAVFLPGYENRERRSWLWRLFQTAEQEAKSFSVSRDSWIVLKRVVPKQHTAMWFDNGTIEIDPSFDPGTLFHEIFHTAYHRSPLRAGGDEAWGEAFCDAFRYMVEKQLIDHERSEWFQKIDRFADMSYEQIMANSGDRRHDQLYGYPASLIVRAANKEPDEFRRLWFALVLKREQSGKDVLNNYFKYDMQSGKPF